MIKRNEKGRSMIEMLGVLGIMTVIVVIGVIASQSVFKSNKATETKNDISMIASHLRKIYVKNGYTADGYVLGEDETFQTLFVDSGIRKNSTTPFGGVYELSAITKDKFQLAITGIETEDCNLLMNNMNFLDEYPEVEVACGDKEGDTQLANKYVDTSDGNSILDDIKDPYNGYIVSDDLQEAIDNATEAELYSACRTTSNPAICDEWLKTNPSLAELKNACATGPTPYVNEKRYDTAVCNAYISQTNETHGSFGGLAWLCERAVTEACDALITHPNTKPEELLDACDMGYSKAVCDAWLATNPTDQAQLAQGCRGGIASACDAFMATDPSTDLISQSCSPISQEMCSKLEEYIGTGILTSEDLSNGCKSGNAALCNELLAQNPTGEDLYSACRYGRGTNDAVCQAYADYVDQNPDSDVAHVDMIYHVCRYSDNDAVCDEAFEQSPYTIKWHCKDATVGEDAVCNAMAEKYLSGESPTTSAEVAWACGYSANTELCRIACEEGNNSACLSYQATKDAF
ncbi:MAG: hypothetical protein N4A44_04565 [Alphaproteobacteria bacterium]|jgi:Tfp pilus assembly protein PilE|nr:hypothetical protein [Alphaproteobacteria bacterium]